MGSLLDKLNYLKETKDVIKTWLKSLGFNITDEMPFRKYKDADNCYGVILNSKPFLKEIIYEEFEDEIGTVPLSSYTAGKKQCIEKVKVPPFLKLHNESDIGIEFVTKYNLTQYYDSSRDTMEFDYLDLSELDVIYGNCICDVEPKTIDMKENCTIYTDAFRFGGVNLEKAFSRGVIWRNPYCVNVTVFDIKDDYTGVSDKTFVFPCKLTHHIAFPNIPIKVESLRNAIEMLDENAGSKYFYIGSDNKAKLTEDEINEVSRKGWILL